MTVLTFELTVTARDPGSERLLNAVPIGVGKYRVGAIDWPTANDMVREATRNVPEEHLR